MGLPLVFLNRGGQNLKTMKVHAQVVSPPFPSVSKSQVRDYFATAENWNAIYGPAAEGKFWVDQVTATGFTMSNTTAGKKPGFIVSGIQKDESPNCDLSYLVTVPGVMTFVMRYQISESPVVITRSICDVSGPASCMACLLVPKVLVPTTVTEHANAVAALGKI